MNDTTIETAVAAFWTDGLFGVTEPAKLLAYCYGPRWVARGIDSEGRFYLLSDARPRKGVAQVVPVEVFEARAELQTVEMGF